MGVGRGFSEQCVAASRIRRYRRTSIRTLPRYGEPKTRHSLHACTCPTTSTLIGSLPEVAAAGVGSHSVGIEWRERVIRLATRRVTAAVANPSARVVLSLSAGLLQTAISSGIRAESHAKVPTNQKYRGPRSELTARAPGTMSCACAARSALRSTSIPFVFQFCTTARSRPTRSRAGSRPDDSQNMRHGAGNNVRRV